MKKTYEAEFCKMIEMVHSVTIEASSEEEAYEIAEGMRNDVSDLRADEWSCEGTDTTLAHVSEI